VIELHPQFLEKDGEKAFVVLPFEEFERLQKTLADFEDLQMLRTAQEKEGDAPTLSLAEAKKELGLI
jgi:hypothetical protein